MITRGFMYSGEQEAMLAELKKIAKSYNLGISLFNINTEVNDNENKD